MAMNDSRITAEESAKTGVVSQPDTLTGSAKENKKAFDALPNLLIERLNALIDTLQAAGCAAELGAAPFAGVNGKTVQAQLAELQSNLTQTDEKLREEITTAGGAGMVGATPFDGVTGTTAQAQLMQVQENLTAYIRKLLTQDGAAQVGVKPFPGVASTVLQAALQEIQRQIDDMTAGVIPDFGITTSKLALGAVTQDRLAQEVVDAIEAVAPSRASGELDDYTMETGVITNTGEGWNEFFFREAFESAPVVTVTPEAFGGWCEVRDVTARGFCYRLQKPVLAGGTAGIKSSVTTEKVYVGAGTGTNPNHTEKTVVTAVMPTTPATLPTLQCAGTADKVRIHYMAAEYGGD